MEDKKNLYQHVDEKFIVDYYKFIPTREQLEDLPKKKPNKVFHTYINNNLTIIIVEKIRLNTKRRNYPITLNQPFNIKYKHLYSVNTKNEVLKFIKKVEKYSFFNEDKKLHLYQDLTLTLNKKEL